MKENSIAENGVYKLFQMPTWIAIHEGLKFWGRSAGKKGLKKGRGKRWKRAPKTRILCLFPSQYHRPASPKMTIKRQQ